MPESIRQQILSAVLTRCASILTSGGYQTNIGEKVTEWDTTPIQTRRAQGIDIRDVADTCDEKLSRHQDRSLNILATIHWSGQNAAENLRKAAADVSRMIGVDRFWEVSGTRLALNTRLTGDGMDIQQGENGITFGAIQIRFEIDYRTASFNPFAHQA